MHTNFRYPVKLVDNEAGGFIITFPDLPQALSEGIDRENALKNAVDCLDVALLYYIDNRLALPMPGKKADAFVYPSAEIAAKLIVVQLWQNSGMSKTELAQRLGVKESEARRILNPRHNTKLITLNAAARAMGSYLEITLGAA